MPYFPKPEDEGAYTCPGCGGRFVPSDWSCLVTHAPGTCCHRGERMLMPSNRVHYDEAFPR